MRIMDINQGTMFRPSDFANSRYHGMTCYNRKDSAPVLVMMSKSSNPPHYMVLDGYKQMFYLNYADATAYCERMGYRNATLDPKGR